MSAWYETATTQTASTMPDTATDQGPYLNVVTLSRPSIFPHIFEASDSAFAQYRDEKFSSPLQRELFNLYRKAYLSDSGTISLADGGLELGGADGVIGPQGKTQMMFPLLNGEVVGGKAAIGLPSSCSQIKLLSITKDTEKRGLWLEISAIDKNNQPTTRKVLLLHKPIDDIKRGGGREQTSIISEADLNHVTLVDTLTDLYREATTNGSVDLTDSPLELGGDGGVIGSSGRPKTTFPLLNEEVVGANASIGLPKLCSQIKLLSITKDTEKSGLWLEISAINQNNQPATHKVLLLHKPIDRIKIKKGGIREQTSIISEADLNRITLVDRLTELYKEATANGSVDLTDDPLELGGAGGVIAPKGNTQTTFPLLNEEVVGDNASIGLPKPCSQIKLLSITKEDRGLWLEISAINQNNQPATHKVLLLHKPIDRIKMGIREQTSIISEADLNQITLGDRLTELYRKATANGSVDLTDSPLELGGAGGVISSEGKTQTTFPLLNGEVVGAPTPIGLPSPCSQIKLLSITKDTEKSGLWLEISAIEKDKQPITRKVLLLQEPIDRIKIKKGGIREQDSIISETVLNHVTLVDRLTELYREATTNGSVDLRDSPLELGGAGGVIAPRGKTQTTFPLLNGEVVGAPTPIGLPSRCSQIKLLSITKDDEDRGLWLEISAIDKNYQPATHKVLLLQEPIDRIKIKKGGIREQTSIISEADLNQHTLLDRLTELYKEATANGSVDLRDSPLELGGAIRSEGTTQTTFPLLNGEVVGASTPIGLPNPCSQIKLLSITKDDEDRGLWLEISAINQNNQPATHKVLLLHKPIDRIKMGIREQTSIISETVLNRITLVDRLTELYRKATANGSVDLRDSPLELGGDGGVIRSDGATKTTFPLPNGLQIKKSIALTGLKNFSSFQLLGITYDEAKNHYTLSIQGEDGGRTQEVLLTLSGEDGLKGKDAIISNTSVPRKRLPEAFMQRAQEARALKQTLSKTARRKTSHIGIHYVKGQCFEQLVGVLLAAESPDERLIPQYCLRVEPDSGYYGMRVDFKIGNECVEVKWGKATDNIHETHTEHQKWLTPPPPEYTILNLEVNEELQVPYTLFSERLENHPLKEELNETMAAISALVYEGEAEGASQNTKYHCAQKLAAIRDLLYDSFHGVSSTDNFLRGKERIEALRESLNRINTAEDPCSLTSTLSRHWSSLEAYVAIDGELFDETIPVYQLAKEEPEAYDVGFVYKMKKSGSEATEQEYDLIIFSDKEAACLLYFLELGTRGAEGYLSPNQIHISGEKNEHGWYINPTFTVTIGEQSYSLNQDADGGELSQLGFTQPSCDLKTIRTWLSEDLKNGSGGILAA